MADYIASLEQRLYQFISRSDYRPMKQHELARALRVPMGEKRALRQSLIRLEADGKIVSIRKNRWALPDAGKLQEGVLSVHPDGFGFVTLEAPGHPDVFIPNKGLGVALHGDRVQLSIGGRRGGGRRRGAAEPPQVSGRVERVLERELKEVTGIYKVTPHDAFVIPDNPRILPNVQVKDIDSGARSVRDQHRVVIALLPWTRSDQPLPGKIIEDLGPADAPGVEMQSLIRGHGLIEPFPHSVEQSAREIEACAGGEDDEQRRDLREEMVITIDPVDARDFDDAVSLVKRSDGNWQLSVHIADVAAYVPVDSAIDKEARQRGTSVYLVDRVIHMLPRHLTEEVCSLNPQVDRWAHSVSMTITPRGKVIDCETYPSIIRSKARLNYEQVQAVIENQDGVTVPKEVLPLLRDMHDLSEVLRHKRARAGSILFDMPEVRCELDAQGQPVRIVPRRSFAAYHLIEEFMLLANQTVARLISEKGTPCVYRVHEPPDEDAWVRMGVELAALGMGNSMIDRDDMNAVAEQVAGTPMAHIVNLAMLRNLKRAVYSAERAEHFGLAFSHYLHFTSPIRRYPDLIVHRVLKAIERNQRAPYREADIERMAAHCSKMEREAADAEEQSITLKRIEYYAAQLEKGEIGPYPALVTGMNSRGLLVELVDTLQRGLVPFALMRQDHYDINPDRTRAVGRRTRHTFKIGEILDVGLVRVDKFRKLVDFAPVPKEAPPGKRSRRRPKGTEK